MRRSTALLALITGLTVSVSAGAEGLKVEPGKWEIRMTTVMPMIPQPIENIGTQCIAESEMKPDEFLRDSGECTFSDVVTAGSKFSWAMNCKNEGGELSGTGSFVSKGPEMTGTVNMVMNAEGQKMTMNTTWEGKRIGPCD